MLLCGYYTCGFPDTSSSLQIFNVLAEICDIVEVGIPFSDPIADGPTIQKATAQAIKAGFKVSDAFLISEKIADRTKVALMTYYNIILKAGEEKFLKKACESGVWAVIVPDLPPEEAGDFLKLCKRYKIGNVFFVTPVTPPERAELVAKLSDAFLYYVTVKGTTGEREKLPDDIRQNLTKLKRTCQKYNRKLLVGFGISKREHVSQLKGLCDGVIIGSAIIRRVMQSPDIKTAQKKVEEFLLSIKNAF